MKEKKYSMEKPTSVRERKKIYFRLLIIAYSSISEVSHLSRSEMLECKLASVIYSIPQRAISR